ncbi:2,5-diamino-6-ribosylamino-4(3H)-pyrimidinone 5'-phosphate reductase [Nocardioides aquaticus]|uniref:2,5-diamino-6-ribosylamino-4(3H)-pyrimidinone 5'-phosphate reductase n=1 Tax=Nocardioides aquaticus TaxID=160826 RepID=A0ABX8EDA7_9ACTN|nr:dihydrofolate reductase family protein [Nocardioides aquaticus]QVT78447.1 2,5-diamino-6-ribosylamino-4(3H)-pyrimidinone 5'-phosphate reductase [Nocardioides aquaticus]
MRLLLGPDAPRDVAVDDLAGLYARPADAPDGPWIRACMISSLDGAATGPDGLSGGLNNEPDHAVFGALRGLVDAVLVGAGTARDEGYGPADVPIVLLSRGGRVPDGLRDAEPGRVVMVVPAGAEHLGEAEQVLGADNVWVVGEDEIDFAALRDRMTAAGWREVTCEGGPTTLAALLAAGLIDEVAATVVPRVLAGEHARMSMGPDVDVDLDLISLLEQDGTLLGRWRVRR